MTLEEKVEERTKHALRREANADHKPVERMVNALPQRAYDKCAKALKKKGKGREFKRKGEVLPGLVPANNYTYKSWKHCRGLPPLKRESMKFSIKVMRT